MSLNKTLTLFFMSLLFFACGKDDILEAQNNKEKQSVLSRTYLSKSISTFKINVFYENGAEPYTGNIALSTNKTWDITIHSFRALFNQSNAVNIEAPTELAQMTIIQDQNKSNWTYEELKTLGEKITPHYIEGNKGHISIIFLNGMYNNNSNTLGLHLTGYPFAFVFKDIILKTGGDSTSQKYVEQATIVHEIGHTIGLVNSGIPMHNDHEDLNHPHHTTNSEGVMYWAIENSKNILSALAGTISRRELNLFKNESMADVKYFTH